MNKLVLPEATARYARMLAAMGTEPRLRIVRLLLAAHHQGMVVGEIADELGIPNSTLSHHLDKLKHEGLVTVRREGTYLREAKDAVRATHQLLETVDMLLAHDPDLRIAIEPKPNEPMDIAYIPTIGHALALGMQASDPARVKNLCSLQSGGEPQQKPGRICTPD